MKSTRNAYLFWIVGLHYAYVNKWILQFAFWVTFGAIGIWWLIDAFRIKSLVDQYNSELLALREKGLHSLPGAQSHIADIIPEQTKLNS